jgi:hypothetical protein
MTNDIQKMFQDAVDSLSKSMNEYRAVRDSREPECEDCGDTGFIETGYEDNIRLVKCHCQKAKEIDFETDNTEYKDGELQR